MWSVQRSAVAALFALGLVAKPMPMTLLFLLFLDRRPLGRDGPLARIVVEKLPLFLSAASCVAACGRSEKPARPGPRSPKPPIVR